MDIYNLQMDFFTFNATSKLDHLL